MEIEWNFTALVSVATAEAMNIIENVTTISMIRAWIVVPKGDVVHLGISEDHVPASMKNV